MAQSIDFHKEITIFTNNNLAIWVPIKFTFISPSVSYTEFPILTPPNVDYA
jgi:hypothetical protein